MTIKDWLFTWSPTDGKIAYWHFSGADQVCEQNSIDNIHDLAWMNAAGGTQTIVKANVTYRLSAWLPNGSGLVAVNDYNALVSGQPPRRLGDLARRYGHPAGRVARRH